MSDSSTSVAKVPYLVSSAIVPISIGTLCIERLQLALNLLSEGRDLSTIEQRITSGTVVDSHEIAIVNISALLAHIYQQAETAGMIEYRPFDISALGG